MEEGEKRGNEEQEKEAVFFFTYNFFMLNLSPLCFSLFISSTNTNKGIFFSLIIQSLTPFLKFNFPQFLSNGCSFASTSVILGPPLRLGY